MEREIGEEKAIAIRKYQGLITLTKEEAKEILVTIWPGAKGPELYKAMSICTQYGLNPLMKHLYMIPFKEGGTDKVNLVCVLGIGANRLIASRKHQYSYIDDTPRMMTEEEEVRRYGEADKAKLHGITKLKDIKTGAEASGYGEWPRGKEPYGTDKGNSKANMVFIRSERQALDKLYPADMPSSDIPVVDENYIEGEGHVIEEKPGEIPQPEAGKENIKQPVQETTGQEQTKVETKPKRDSSTIKTTTDLYKACHADFGLQPADTMKELNIKAWSELTKPPADCYREIASTRR